MSILVYRDQGQIGVDYTDAYSVEELREDLKRIVSTPPDTREILGVVKEGEDRLSDLAAVYELGLRHGRMETLSQKEER